MLYQYHRDWGTSLYELIFVVSEDPHINYFIAPYVVLKDDKGEYTYSSHRVYTNTICDYGLTLTEDGRKLFANIEQLAPPQLEEQFQPKKRKSYTLRELVKNEEIRKTIHQYVDNRFGPILELIYQNKARVFFQYNESTKLTRHPITLAETPIDAVFHFQRTSEGFSYSLSASVGDEEIILTGREVHILCNKPGWLIIDGVLYKTNESLNGKLFQPFVTKDAITIPKSKEREYFEKFIINKVRNNSVNAEGFAISTSSPDPYLSLSLVTEPFDDHHLLAAYFYYNKEQFFARDQRHEKVSIGFNDEGDINLFKTERNKEQERALLAQLDDLGFEKWKDGYYKLANSNGNGHDQEAIYELVDRLADLRETLARQNIYLDHNPRHHVPMSFHKPELSFAVESNTDWFDIKATVTIGDYSFPFTDFYDHILNGKREFELPDGSIAILPNEWFAQYRELLTMGEQEQDHIYLNYYQGVLLQELNNANKNQQDGIGTEFNIGHPTKDVPLSSSLKANLRPYQQYGVNWMEHIRENGFGGCLADEMGLGKTLQTLAMLLYQKERLLAGFHHDEIVPASNGNGKSESNQLQLFGGSWQTKSDEGQLKALIVMPVSLIHNWKQEIERFTPSLSVHQHTGINRPREATVLQQHDIILTTYSIARNDLQLFQQIDFNSIVLDESQYIKNPRSKTYKAVTQLKGKHKMVLTGTPIENSLSDLWAQVNFFNPGMLGSFRFFKEEFIDPVEKHEDEQKRTKLKKLVQPFILRRTIQQVARDLPNLTEKVFYSEMPPEQQELYEEEKSKARNKILENLKQVGRAKTNILILKSLTRLRQIANHPALCFDEGQQAYPSGKYNDVLENLMNILEGNHKVLIFSQFVSHLDLFRTHLDKEGISYGYLTGTIGSDQRQKEIEQFQNDPATKVFLISLSAGGTGLNLTAASHVFLLDPWWNPARESQAIRRAHRIGQDKNVFAYKFITVDTVEEKILKLQQRKKQLAEDFMPSEDQLNLSNEDLEYLLE